MLCFSLLAGGAGLQAGAAQTAAGCPGGGPAASAEIRFREAVEWLSDDLRAGRGARGGGLVWAGEWIEERLAETGLVPAGVEGWRQPVPAGGASDLPASERPAREGFNLLGVLPAAPRVGSSGRPGERAGGGDPRGGVVVVAAHYDHLGYGGWLSEEPGNSEVHNGADDNASGIAALLEVGRCLVAGGPRRRPVLLAAVTYEEVGRLGSRALLESLRRAGTPVVAMIDLDMVGRLGEGSLEALAASSSPEWAGLLEASCGAAGVSCVPRPDDGEPSDHRPFLEAGVPAMWLTTGRHGDWHRPTDDADRIDARGGVRVARVAAALAAAVADRVRPLARAVDAPATGSSPRGAR